MSILDKGSVTVDRRMEENVEVLNLSFHGKALRGKWTLSQEERASEAYSLEKAKELSKGRFSLQEHKIGEKSHWDVRVDVGWEGKLLEWNLPFNPLEVNSQPAVKKICTDPSWLEKGKKGWEKAKVGPLETEVRELDSGPVEVLETSPLFYSFQFKGEKLKGLWILINRGEGFRFEASKLPFHLSKDPLAGKEYDPPVVEKKPKRMLVYLYDPRFFTRAEPDFKEYLPDLSLPAGVKDVVIALYQVPGKIRFARVMAVIFDPEEFTEEAAINWVKKNKLAEFVSLQIRHEKG